MGRRPNHQRGTQEEVGTHQAAMLLGVSGQTVANWIDTGALRGFRTAGGHRRVRAIDLYAFAVATGVRITAPLRALVRDLVRSVLIVDDDDDFSEGLAEYLTLKGFVVTRASSGFGAGIAVAKVQPHLIIMDLRMPEMDGFEALRHLRALEETRDVPVIATTAYRDANVDKRIQLAGFNDFVEKPASADEFFRAIRRLIGMEEPS